MTTTANKANKLDRFVRKHENVLRSLLLNAVILLFLLLLLIHFMILMTMWQCVIWWMDPKECMITILFS